MEVFRIWVGVEKYRHRTTSITVQGTCCWEIYGRNGEKQELFPGQRITPSVAYIRKLKTKKCTDSGKIRASH